MSKLSASGLFPDRRAAADGSGICVARLGRLSAGERQPAKRPVRGDSRPVIALRGRQRRGHPILGGGVDPAPGPFVPARELQVDIALCGRVAGQVDRLDRPGQARQRLGVLAHLRLHERKCAEHHGFGARIADRPGLLERQIVLALGRGQPALALIQFRQLEMQRARRPPVARSVDQRQRRGVVCGRGLQLAALRRGVAQVLQQRRLDRPVAERLSEGQGGRIGRLGRVELGCGIVGSPQVQQGCEFLRPVPTFTAGRERNVGVLQRIVGPPGLPLQVGEAKDQVETRAGSPSMHGRRTALRGRAF